jgi:phage gp46-like protein
MQQGDVLLFQTDNEGDINVVGGLVEMSGGLETAAYLSLFGGNEDDTGIDSNDNPLTWWANLDETDPALQYRSETQNLLQGIPATTGNLIRIEDAAKRDLAWFIEKKVASTIVVTASIPGINRIKIVIDIEARGEESSFEFVENWKVST